MKKAKLPVRYSQDYKISEFGAIPGGRTSCTKAIQEAVDSAYRGGGGRVVIPEGIWLTGAICLKSRVELHLKKNCILLFDKNSEEYPLGVTQYEGIARIRARSPLYAENEQDIAITGEGIIDGNGHLWRIAKEFKFPRKDFVEMTQKSPDTLFMTKEGAVWFPTKSAYEGFCRGEILPTEGEEQKELEAAAPYYDYYRPVMVSFVHCQRILIEGVILQNSPAWNVHPLFCQDVTIRNATIRNDPWAQNGDGLDLESCSRVEVANVTFDVGDDAICIKSGKNREARKIKVPAEEIHIHDCTVFRGHGGFTIGSEMSRGVRNVLVERCNFIGTDTGIRLKSALGRGGVVEDIWIRDIQMLRIRDEAIVMSMKYVLDQPGKKTEGEDCCIDSDDIPEFRKIHLNRICCLGAKQAVKIEGIQGESKIHDIDFQDVYLEAEKEGTVEGASGIQWNNTKICCYEKTKNRN